MSSRLRATIICFTRSRLVYAKRSLSLGVGTPYPAKPGQAEPTQAEKNSSCLRQTLTFQNIVKKTCASSTRGAHFENGLSSRLRETLVFFASSRLVYAKCLHWMTLMAKAPSRAPAKHSWCTGQKLATRCFLRLVYAKHQFLARRAPPLPPPRKLSGVP